MCFLICRNLFLCFVASASTMQASIAAIDNAAFRDKTLLYMIDGQFITKGNMVTQDD